VILSSYLIYHAISKGVSNNLSRAMCVDRVCVDVFDSTSVRSVSSALLLYPLRHFLASRLWYVCLHTIDLSVPINMIDSIGTQVLFLMIVKLPEPKGFNNTVLSCWHRAFLLAPCFPADTVLSC
jgi:hypothetical protein